jgi:hypothetical protein
MKHSTLLVVTVLLTSGCNKAAKRKEPRTASQSQAGSQSQADSQPRESPMVSPKSRRTASASDSASASASHALTPASALKAWLEKHARQKGRRARFKLPVVIRSKDGFVLGRLRAFVGTSTADTGADKLALALEDTALGVSLRDRLRSKCPEGARSCAIWLEGHWGPLVPAGPTARPKAGPHPFAVRHVGPVIPSGTKSARVTIVK